MKKIYIVVSRTGTLLSKMIHLITKDEYTHASLALSPELEIMYSFGRKNPLNPFIGGFVVEGKNTGTFKRFKNTRVKVLELDVTEEEYERIQDSIIDFIKNKNAYRYNYEGLLLAVFDVNIEKRNAYYCSQFVKSVLERNNVIASSQLPDITSPNDFLSLNYSNILYQGMLREYSYT